MAKTIKPTLIMLAVIALPFLIVAGVFMYQEGILTFRNLAIVMLVAPIGCVIFVLMHKDNAEKYGVISDEQRQRDAKKYLDKHDT